MTAQEQWQRLQTLFELALGTPAAERERALEAAGADEELKSRILQMVAGVEQDSPDTSEAPAYDGRRLGPHTLIRLIDTGGMGAVYLAERLIGGVPQRVALKVLAPRFCRTFLPRALPPRAAHSRYPGSPPHHALAGCGHGRRG
jgi:hypothetical protein